MRYASRIVSAIAQAEGGDMIKGRGTLLLVLMAYLVTFLAGLVVADLRREPQVMATSTGTKTIGFGLLVAFGLLPMLLTWGMNLIVFHNMRYRVARASAWHVALLQAVAGALVFLALTIAVKADSHFTVPGLIVFPLAITYVIYRYFGGARGAPKGELENA